MLSDKDIQLINETLAEATPVTGKYLTPNSQSVKIEPLTTEPLSSERTNMPYLQPGEKLSTGFSEFFKLKNVGDKIRFRILGVPFVEGKHFFESPEGWDIQPCVRVNDGESCHFCNTYFNAIKAAKKMGDDREVKKVRESKEVKGFKCSISVYYPVLNRDEAKFVVFQTTMGVRDDIESEVAMGAKVDKTDFIVLRANKQGANTYKTSKADSNDTPPLTAEEKAEVEKGKAVKLDEMIAGSADTDSEVAQDVETIVVEGK